MLIDEPQVMVVTPILAIIAESNGRSEAARRLQQGVYEIGHFGGSNFLQGYDEHPDVGVGSYGVCDTVEQLLKLYPELEASPRQFVVTVTPIRRAEEPKYGGWRWHKWGPYIGTKDPQCEYLADEPFIEEVLVYHIYERAAS